MSNSIRIHNSMGREKQEFEPVHEDSVRIYVCGVTVYDECHVGHGRVYVTFDVVRRFLEFEEYDVKYVVNITDLDDKIINRAEKQNTTPAQLSQNYSNAYFRVMDKLNILRADVHPTVTGHIPQIIEHVEGLIDKGMAYEVDGNVYFDVEKFEDYGKLSGQDPDEMQSGSRVDVDDRKKSPLDFALWKRSEAHEPSWESPWGRGRPGWHIECSVMSGTHLGETLDIHGGGRDLIFPHHENEIAQTEALTGKPFSNYWMHNGFVTIDDEKMSKSEGNFYTLTEIFDDFEPRVVRYFYLTRHYRSPLNFSFDRLREARTALHRLDTFYERLLEAESWSSGADQPSDATPPEIEAHKKSFLDFMRDDFNTAHALGYLQNWVKDWNSVLDEWEKKGSLHRTEHVAITDARNWMETALRRILGIPEPSKKRVVSDSPVKIEGILDRMVQLRDEARNQENYEFADRIRDQLQELGYKIEDRPKGTEWEPIDDE